VGVERVNELFLLPDEKPAFDKSLDGVWELVAAIGRLTS